MQLTAAQQIAFIEAANDLDAERAGEGDGYGRARRDPRFGGRRVARFRSLAEAEAALGARPRPAGGVSDGG